jgi:hypothetical protein
MQMPRLLCRLAAVLADTPLVTGKTGVVTFWEAQHAAMPTKCHAYHAISSGRHSALTVTMPPFPVEILVTARPMSAVYRPRAQ